MEGSSTRNGYIDLKLSLSRDKVYRISKMEEELFREELANLPPLNEGEISIDGVYAVPLEDKLQVGIFLRNATTAPILFRKCTLKLIGNDGSVWVKQEFSLGKAGDLPAFSGRPWEVEFELENVYVEPSIIGPDNWKIVFDLPEGDVPYFPMVEDRQPEPLNQEQISRLHKVFKELPPIKEGAIYISPFDLAVQEDGYILVTIIVRHNIAHPIILSRFPLELLDAQRKVVARACFDIDEFALEAKSFFLKTFAFPESTFLVKEADLTNWNISANEAEFKLLITN